MAEALISDNMAEALDMLQAIRDQKIADYTEWINHQMDKMIVGMKTPADLHEPTDGHEWVVSYEVSQILTGPGHGPFEESVRVTTSHSEEPVDKSEGAEL